MLDCMFKGVCVETKKWIYGDHIRDKYGRHFIGTIDFEEVDNKLLVLNPFTLKEVYVDTISKNTEIQDIYERYVYENDILQLNSDLVAELWIPEPSCVVVYQNGNFFTNHGTQLSSLNSLLDEDGILRGQVINTIFENRCFC